MAKRILLFLTLGLFFIIAIPAQAQNVDQDFSEIKVDDLTDAQVRMFMKQVEAAGMSLDDIEQIAEARGMSPTEIRKLRFRVEKIKKEPDTKKTETRTREVNMDGADNPDDDRDKKKRVRKDDKMTDTEDEEQDTEDNINELGLPRLRSKIFGAALFKKSGLTFEPNLRLATPMNYQLGPDDEILIDVYGYSEASYQLKVSPDGTINIPMAGVVSVSGATMEQASARIKSRLANVYPGIRTGSTSVAISLGNIRSIRVILTGEIIKPGTYTLPSVATVFNALYSSGGPSDNGSFRQVEVIRAGEVVGVLDVYDFLLFGSLKNNVRLQDQDIIHVPTYRTRVEMSGQTKRTGIFEMKYGETLADLIRFAGGFKENAYQARIKVLKNTETEHKIEDVTTAQFESYIPSSGDKYIIDEILDRYKNRVTINGAVFRAGQYELSPGLTLSQLVNKAEGLKEDAFRNRGYILRVKDDLTTEMVSFDVGGIVSGQDPDIALKREDIVMVPSIFDLREEYRVTIDGEVRQPGVFDYAENMTLQELILQSGGFKESATPKRIEIARRVKNSDLASDSSRIAQVFHVDIDTDLNKESADFILKPFDIVAVRAAPGYQVQRTVKLEGEVLFPGTYSIISENERVSDLIKRAGGLSRFAYLEGASLKRASYKKTQIEQEKENLKIKQFEQFQKKVDDSSKVDVKSEVTRNDYVGIDLPKILDNPGRRYDLLLEDGDILNIPKQLQTVKVSGEVLSPSSVVYIPSNSFKNYVLQSGGFSSKALKRRAYIIYANGSIASTKKFLFFNNYPSVKPGAEIFVPLKETRDNKLSTTEIVAITTGLATIATLVFTILR
jgi:protein involved in polysaccharide export with SLBB domain